MCQWNNEGQLKEKNFLFIYFVPALNGNNNHVVKILKMFPKRKSLGK